MEHRMRVYPEMWASRICPWCDDVIEDDPVSYTEPVEVEGVGVVHAYCAEEAMEHDSG